MDLAEQGGAAGLVQWRIVSRSPTMQASERLLGSTLGVTDPVPVSLGVGVNVSTGWAQIELQTDPGKLTAVIRAVQARLAVARKDQGTALAALRDAERRLDDAKRQWRQARADQDAAGDASLAAQRRREVAQRGADLVALTDSDRQESAALAAQADAGKRAGDALVVLPVAEQLIVDARTTYNEASHRLSQITTEVRDRAAQAKTELERVATERLCDLLIGMA